MRETPHTVDRYSLHSLRNVKVKIRRTRGQSAGKAQMYWEPSETLRSELPMKLDEQWITGFVDGEGCFHVGINKHSDMTAGYQVLPEFTVVQHKRDIQLLHAMKAYFGCGVVRSNHGDRMAFRVRDKKLLLQRIVPFFIKYPLKSKKRMDFEKFHQVLKIMEVGDHLSEEGVLKIRNISSQMNRGKLR